MAHGLQNAGAGVLERGCQGGPRGETVAAAAELLGDAGDIDTTAGAKANLDAAAWLLHEKEANLDTGHAARVVDQVLAVHRRRTRCLVVGAADFGVPHQSAVGDLEP